MNDSSYCKKIITTLILIHFRVKVSRKKMARIMIVIAWIIKITVDFSAVNAKTTAIKNWLVALLNRSFKTANSLFPFFFLKISFSFDKSFKSRLILCQKWIKKRGL